ncbi:ATP-DEPENDENT HELICASE HRQ1 [Salix koriyanagi]|uniref:ATP-DEPENDENT HELICASE HRQ1 n=1 Tax=Salix koriyanagi TaxID=2511006 RepID=A0A9Q1ABH9_9ROSI|nr:ATP-DEPENDENT HELICASE HRQ1 [Salix koriyanagi]
MDFIAFPFADLVNSLRLSYLIRMRFYLVDSICGYRAGYVVEREIFSVGNSVATNALEFGVDVGHIDVTLHLGFPGSVASLWQQAGRSGRRERPSLAVPTNRQTYARSSVYLSSSSLSNGLMTLKNKGDLSFDPSLDSSSTIWSYIGHEKMPSRGISIRAMESIRHGVIEMQWNEVLEETEISKAFFQIYEGAVCIHQGKTYMVKELDISEKDI